MLEDLDLLPTWGSSLPSRELGMPEEIQQATLLNVRIPKWFFEGSSPASRHFRPPFLISPFEGLVLYSTQSFYNSCLIDFEPIRFFFFFFNTMAPM